jgi:tetratricopeptide (TPR) repeat protein
MLFFNIWFSYSQKIDTTLIRLEKDVKFAVSDSLKVNALLELGGYQKKRDFIKVGTYTDEIFKILEKANYDVRPQKAKTYNLSGIGKRRLSDFTGALRDYFSANDILLEINDSLELGPNYHNIGVVYRFQKEYEKSIVNFKKAIQIHKKYNKPKRLGNNYSMMAISYQKENKTDSTFYYYDTAIQYYKKANYFEGEQQALSNKASFLSKRGKFNEALLIQLKYLEFVKKINKKLAIISANISLSSTFLGLKQYNKSIEYANVSVELANKRKSKLKQSSAYLQRSKVYKALHKYEFALKDYQAHIKVKQDIFNLKKTKKLREIELQHFFSKKQLADSIQHAEEKKIILLQSENEKLEKRLYIAVLITMLLLISFIFYFGLRYFKRRNKKNQIKATKLVSEIDTLNSEISVKREEITGLMTETLIHLRSKEKLTEELSVLSKQKEGNFLNSIIAGLKADKLEDSKIIYLKKNIETLNYDFLKRLKEKHETLTKTDIEVCSFIKLGLSRKEVAHLRKTSLEAVKSTRFRLKKKLKLTSDDSLDCYVNSL